MHRDIAGVLNREDMTELRAGYSIAIYNSRGVHNVDPTGKPEQQLCLSMIGVLTRLRMLHSPTGSDAKRSCCDVPA